MLQIYLMDLLAGCVGFQLESEQSSSHAGQFCLRYDPLYRLRISLNSVKETLALPEHSGAQPGVKAYLELMTPPGDNHLFRVPELGYEQTWSITMLQNSIPACPCNFEQ